MLRCAEVLHQCHNTKLYTTVTPYPYHTGNNEYNKTKTAQTASGTSVQRQEIYVQQKQRVQDERTFALKFLTTE